mgnify:CR=1 FL=1
MNHKMFLVLALVLLSGCNTVRTDRTPARIDRTLQPIDCTAKVKSEECLAVANLDKKNQKKAVKPTQSEQRARLAKIAENKKLNDEKAKAKVEVKSETLPLAQDEIVVSKPDLKTQKQIDSDNREKAFAASMDCVKKNLRKKDDIRTPVRAVAYELATMCRQKGAPVDSIANATVPLVSQSRAPKKTK